MPTIFGIQITEELELLHIQMPSERVLRELSPKVFAVVNQLPLPLCVPSITNYLDLGQDWEFHLEKSILLQIYRSKTNWPRDALCTWDITWQTLLLFFGNPNSEHLQFSVSLVIMCIGVSDCLSLHTHRHMHAHMRIHFPIRFDHLITEFEDCNFLCETLIHLLKQSW